MTARLAPLLLAGLLAAPAGAQRSEVGIDGEAWMERGRSRSAAQEPAAALSAFESAAAAFAAAGDGAGEARAWLEQGLVLARSGAVERGAGFFERALARFTALDEPARAARAHLQLASVARLRRNDPAAERHLDRALALFERASDAAGLAEVAYRRSTFAAGAGDHAAAVQHARRAAAAFARLGSELRRAEALRNVAYGLQHLGEEERAGELYAEVLEVAWRHNAQALIQNVYCNRAEIGRRRGELGVAEAELRSALAGFEQLHARSPTTPEERAAALDLQVAAYDRLVLLLADSRRTEEAFAVAERFHARSLLAMLGERHLDHAGRRVGDLRRRERALLAELGAARLELERAAGEPAARRRLTELGRRLDELRARIGRRSAAYDELVAPRPPTAAEVRAGLEPGEVLVAYWVSDERTLAWVLSREEVRFAALPVSRERLRGAVAGYLESLRSPSRAEDAALAGREGAHLEAGRELYRWLVGSLPAAAREARRLVLVLDDVLHYLPFEALVEGCGEGAGAAPADLLHGGYLGCRFLGLERALVYGPSAGSILALRQRSERPPAVAGSLLAMAPGFDGGPEPPGRARRGWPPPPLASSREEVEGIGALFAGAHMLTGEDASERSFKAEAADHRFLHLATHGLIDDALPLSSGVLLGAGGGEDGLLSAYEVLGLELSAELVTLSACRTGGGRLSRGEGIIGLSRAFLYAGASSVVVSLWDVDDRSTPLLMTALYRGLAAGLDRAEALRRARRALFRETTETTLAFRRRGLAYAHPRFWSGFVLIGAP